VGLTLYVGLSPEIREGDPEFVEHFEQQFEVVNDVLESFGLPGHEEPFDIEARRTFECGMYGYFGFYSLQRLAAHLALKGELPPPAERDDEDDPVLQDYCRIFDASFAQGKASGMPFQHLIVHADGEGFYLPVEFEDVLIPDASLEIDGGEIGSAHKLLTECGELARALEIPDGLSVEDEAVSAALRSQGEGDAMWERYGVESYTCLALMRACEVSIETGAAIIFA
jgi:hypothetical protein